MFDNSAADVSMKERIEGIFARKPFKYLLPSAAGSEDATIFPKITILEFQLATASLSKHDLWGFEGHTSDV